MYFKLEEVNIYWGSKVMTSNRENAEENHNKSYPRLINKK